METAAAGEFEGGFGDLPIGEDDAALQSFHIRGVEHNQWTGAFDFLLFTEAAMQPAIVETGVLRSIVFELPAENSGVEELRLLDVGGGEFDVVDAPVVGHVHSSIVAYFLPELM